MSDAAQQLAELTRTHRMADDFLKSTRWYTRLSEAQRNAIPILRSRPDVTLRTDLGREVPVQTVSFRLLDPLSAFLRNMEVKRQEQSGRHCLFGYRGPWWGGWGDIVYAARRDTIDTMVSGLPQLGGLLSYAPREVLTLPPFNERVYVSPLSSPPFRWPRNLYLAEGALPLTVHAHGAGATCDCCVLI